MESAEVIPGVLPDGTPIGKFYLQTANLGDIEWFLSPRQAQMVADELGTYARLAVIPPRRRRRCA